MNQTDQLTAAIVFLFTSLSGAVVYARSQFIDRIKDKDQQIADLKQDNKELRDEAAKIVIAKDEELKEWRKLLSDKLTGVIPPHGGSP